MIRRILLVTLLAAAAGLAQTVNCVVAVVNGQIITLLDVEVTAAFGLGQDPAADKNADPRLAALEVLIDRKIVLDLAREVRGVNKDELASAFDTLRQTIGAETFGVKLGKFGLAPKDLEPYLEDRILCDRALALRFSQSVPVSVTEVERHYRDIYVPEQSRRGIAAEPLERVSAAIQDQIQNERRAEQTTRWVRDLRKNADIQIKKDCLK